MTLEAENLWHGCPAEALHQAIVRTSARRRSQIAKVVNRKALRVAKSNRVPARFVNHGRPVNISGAAERL